MAGTSTLREFLVKLGFVKDESGLKSFVDGIKTATKSVFALAAAIETTAVAVAAGVARYASNLEQLYFASIRTGTAVNSLLAFGKAAQDFGASAEEAGAGVESLAAALRNNPANQGYIDGILRPIGKTVADAKGNMTELLTWLGQAFGKMDVWQAKVYADMLGIPEHLMLALRNGDFERDLQKKQQEYGAGWQKTAEDAHEFMEDLRDLEVQLEAFGRQIEEVLIKKFHFGLKELRTWLAANGPWLAQRIVEIVGKVLDVAIVVAKGIETIIGWFVKMDTATNGWSTKLMALLLILKFFGGGPILTGLLSVGGAFVTMATGITGAAAAVSALGVALAGITGYGLGSWLNKHFLEGGSIQETLGEFMTEVGAQMGFKSSNDTLALQNPMQFLTDKSSFSRNHLAALLANLKAESNLDPNATNGSHYGLAQWDQSRQADFKKWSGHDIHGTSMAEQLMFSLYELTQGSQRNVGRELMQTNDLAGATSLVMRKYENPGNVPQREIDRRQALARSINTNNTFNVYGSADPAATARRTLDAQDRATANAARYFAVGSP